MKITANSKIYEKTGNLTVSDFIRSIGANPKRCVVEYNGKAMRFAQFENIELRDGDKLEIMSVVAGG